MLNDDREEISHRHTDLFAFNSRRLYLYRQNRFGVAAGAHQTEGRRVVKVGVKFNAETRVPEEWAIEE